MPRQQLIEHRTPRRAGIQVRFDGTATAEFQGYASTTGDAYEVRDWLGEYRETILPGAFRKTLQEQRSIPLLHNHDANFVLANTASGTSRLSEDGRGLQNAATLDRRQSYVSDLCIALERGDIESMSFSFAAVRDKWNSGYDDRKVSELRLFDTSIVTYPANPNTTAALKDAMRSALGREGRSLWLAEHELSVRSMLPSVVQRREVPDDGRETLDRAFRAMVNADDAVCQRFGMHGRARTSLVARSMLELRAGKVLSAANQKLLEDALEALSDADQAHGNAATAHSKARDAISGALASAQKGDAEGLNGNQGASAGDSPTSPQDGAGPRSASLKLRRQREAELRRLGVNPRRSSPAALAAQRRAELKRLRAGSSQRRSLSSESTTDEAMLQDPDIWATVVAIEKRLGLPAHGSRIDRYRAADAKRRSLTAARDRLPSRYEAIWERFEKQFGAPLDSAIAHRRKRRAA
jgi:hypothetical protein